MRKCLGDIKDGLRCCKTWITDEIGNRRKPCRICPYVDPEDPAGLNCGEKLMSEALEVLESMEEFKNVTR